MNSPAFSTLAIQPICSEAAAFWAAKTGSDRESNRPLTEPTPTAMKPRREIVILFPSLLSPPRHRAPHRGPPVRQPLDGVLGSNQRTMHDPRTPVRVPCQDAR